MFIPAFRSIIALFVFCSLPVFADEGSSESKWKLSPLAYNNPGLKVDLGVGLWAWPLPMDYDGDGDMDLLVSCPDKPSNGVFFFENGTQNPKDPRPVFKPAVRLGKTTHNFQVSVVNGNPRILKPGYEFPRDSTTGKFDFLTPVKIYPRTNIHDRNVRANMWRYVDYDGDGDQDLIIGVGDWSDYGWDAAFDRNGNWNNGPLHGYIYLISNHGSDRTPVYPDEPIRLTAGGSVIDVYGWPSPNFADFDDDGDLDLLCGEFLDGFTYFQNTGTRSKPAYSAGQKLNNRQRTPLTMDLQMITPTAIDWDSDGDIDLITGDEDGRVALLENTGELLSGAPLFETPYYFQQQADSLKFGALATPFAFDWDQDGDEDILCGNTAGYIGIFENLGQTKSGLPKWSAPRKIKAKSAGSDHATTFRVMAGPSGSIQGPCEAKWGYTTLSVADWNGDNNPDIIYNSIWSRIGLLVGTQHGLQTTELTHGTPETPPSWYWWNQPSTAALTQWRTTPVAIDFDGDENLDLIALDQEGFLALRSHGKAPARIFVDEDNRPIQLNPKSCGSSGRIKLAVVDWDSDGRLDILVNSENATWYRNCVDRENKVVLKKIGNLAHRNVAGHTSSPAVCDFDNDQKPDLLVGSENGRIYHIKHDDCVTYDPTELIARQPKRQPQARFPGFVKEEFVFTKAKFPQCHASTICQTSRGLVVAWFGGTREKDKDVGIWTSYHDGNRWSSPKEWATGVQHESLRYPCWNPVLFQAEESGPTSLFFKVGPDPRSWWGEMMFSYDQGRTFRDRRRLPEEIDGPVRCKPMLLANKNLLCGSSTEHDGWRVHFEKVALEQGKPTGTWRRIGPINESKQFNAIQPTFLKHHDGRIQVLCRTKESVISTSFSADDGETWSPMQATNLPNPNSGIEVVTLQDGRHLMIYNHLGSGTTGWGRRGLLNLAMSSDGLQWKKVAVLEQEEKQEFSYPAIIQTKDGMVHMTYTWKRQRIKHVVVDPSQIETGEILSLENWHEKKQD